MAANGEGSNNSAASAVTMGTVGDNSSKFGLQGLPPDQRKAASSVLRNQPLEEWLTAPL
jgi:hypothetical protein